MTELAVTRHQTTATPGRRYPDNPHVFSLDTLIAPSVVANEVFTPPIPLSLRRFNMIIQNAQKGDVGVALIVEMTNQSDNLPFDISAATALAVLLKKPDGTSVEFVGQLYTNGLDGKIYYVTESDDDLDQIGICFLQGKVTFGEDAIIYSSQVRFQVNDNIEIEVP
jgi:hypothetical protein